MKNQRFPAPRETAGVVLCGGPGSRLWPLTLKKQKSMIGVRGAPIIKHVVDFWSSFCGRFVFVVKHGKEELVEYLKSLPVSSEFAEPVDLRGIANGLSCARPLAGERFIVILGDCICRGIFHFPEGMVQGVGVWRTESADDIRRSYSVKIDPGTNLVSHVEEKPREPPNDLCGMGYYFFDSRVFDYIAKTPPSPLRGEVEITDVIESMIQTGEAISPVMFEGNYINITYPEDIGLAEGILR